MDVQAARGLRAGVSEEKLRAILDYAAHPAFTEAERAALAFAAGLTRTPVAVPEEVFTALGAHFDTPAIVEIAVFAAFQNFNAKFNGALRVEVNELCPIEVPGGRWDS